MIARETVASSKWLVFPQICGFPFFPDEKELSSRKNHSDAKFGSQQLFFFTQLKTVSQNMLLIGCF